MTQDDPDAFPRSGSDGDESNRCAKRLKQVSEVVRVGRDEGDCADSRPGGCDHRQGRVDDVSGAGQSAQQPRGPCERSVERNLVRSVRVPARGVIGGSRCTTFVQSCPQVPTPQRSRRLRCAASPRPSGRCDPARSAHRRRGRVCSSVHECACDGEPSGAVLLGSVCSLADGDRKF